MAQIQGHQNVDTKVLAEKIRVGHRVLLHSERIVLLRSFKECNILLRSFAKNGNERREQNILLKRTEKNVRTKHSFAKRTYERFILFFTFFYFLFRVFLPFLNHF